MDRMKEWSMFAEIKKYKSKGFKKSQVERFLCIDYKTVDKYWDMTPDEYAQLVEQAKTRSKKVDKYEEEILGWIQEYSDISTAQVYDWLQERYGTLDFRDRTLRLYISNLRDKYKLPKVSSLRQYEEVPELPMGYQAQVDLGQIWVKRQDGTKIKVYCFAMVLSHSRYKYLLWSDRPFTTLSFIEAHNRAFEYLGGIPKEIVYDQDRILVVSENNGDIIYTEGFQNYLSMMKYSMYLCRSYDPESKGKIEAVVKYAKYNFARYRTYIDIETFNEDSLKWLQRTGNAKVHEITKKVPAEVFALEKEHLKQVPKIFEKNINDTSLTYMVRKNNTVLYKQNRYQVPKGTYSPGKEVLLVIANGSMDIINKETGEIIVVHPLSYEKGKLVKLGHPERDKSKSVQEMYDRAFEVLFRNSSARELLDTIRIEKARYCKDQFKAIVDAAERFDKPTIEKALEYCIGKKLFSAAMFKDTLEYIKLQNERDTIKKYTKADISVPSKYKGLKPNVRDIREYINALEEDKSIWKN
jgi:transposase